MDRPRRFSALVFAALIFTALAFAPYGHAGLGDAIKKKVTDATKKATEKTEKAADETSEKKPAESSTGDKASADGGGSISSVSTKFDFVPGDSVLFMDDFTQDELGEFPARWKLQSGTFEVAELDGERWLRCVSNDGHIRMKVPPSLPEFWTLEFDGNHLDAAGNTMTVSALNVGGSTVWEAIFPYSGRNLFFRSGEITSDTPFESGTPAGRHHFMFMARGTALKVYMDRDRMANVPDVTANGVPVELEIRLWSTQKPMIANVRFAEGCRPPKDMLAEGKLVTYGIRFATGSDAVLPESAPVLRQIAAYMEANPAVKLLITGHTDNVGQAASNLDLSQRRAASVAKVLSGDFHVAADRLTTDGKGDTVPVSSNAKPEGRAMNRRVEFAKQ